MKFKTLIIAVYLTTTVAPLMDAQTAISQWSFNSTPPDSKTSTGTTSPSVGSGTLSAIGGVSIRYYSGSPGDPADAAGDNSGLNLSSWASPETGSGTCGIQISSSTVGFDNITISLDFRQSSTASRYFQLQVSSDGSTFENVSGGTPMIGIIGSGNSGTTFTADGLYSNISSGSSFVEGISYKLPAGSIYDNNPYFTFRWVAIFDPANGTSYTASDSSNSYGTSGTGRFDQVSISGNSIVAVPEPATMTLIGLGLAALGFSRRRKL